MSLSALIATAFLASNALAAPVMPDNATVDRIQVILDAFSNRRKQTADLLVKKNKIEAAIGLLDEKGRLRQVDDFDLLKEYARRLVGLGTEKYESYLQLATEYKTAQEDVQELARMAIKMARDAYEVIPEKSYGYIQSGPPLPKTEDDIPGYIGKGATYYPVFSERAPDGTYGWTEHDGKVVIGPEAFKYPGLLAYTLYHEGQHFEKLLTPGLDLRNAPAWEVRLRENHRSLLKKRFGLKDEDVENFDEKLKKERIRAGQWGELIRQGASPYNKWQLPGFPGTYPGHVKRRDFLEDGELEVADRILKKAGELREDIARAEAEARIERHFQDLAGIAREACGNTGSVTQDRLSALEYYGRGEIYRSRIDWAAKLTEGEGCPLKLLGEIFLELGRGEGYRSEGLRAEWVNEGARRYHEDRRRLEEEDRSRADENERHNRGRRWDRLTFWTTMACQYLHHRSLSGEESQEVRKAHQEGDRINRQFLLEHFVVLPASEIRVGLAEKGKELDSCQKDVMELFLNAAGPLDAAWLVERFEYERSGGAFGGAIRRVYKSIENGLGAVVKGITDPFIGVFKPGSPSGGNGNGGGREPISPGQAPDSSSREMQLRGPAWKRANEIRRDGW